MVRAGVQSASTRDTAPRTQKDRDTQQTQLHRKHTPRNRTLSGVSFGTRTQCTAQNSVPRNPTCVRRSCLSNCSSSSPTNHLGATVCVAGRQRRAGAQSASTRVTTHSAPHTKRQEHTTDTATPQTHTAQPHAQWGFTHSLTHSLTYSLTHPHRAHKCSTAQRTARRALTTLCATAVLVSAVA